MAALSRLPTLLRWAFLALGCLTALGLGMAALIWHKGNDWKTLAIATVNDQIQGDLEVASVELSWWNGFPDISVDLKQVALTSASGDTMLEAKRVGVELSFWSLWGDHPRVHAVRLEDGQMNVLQDPSGQWNVMDVLSPSSRTSEHDGDGSGFTLDEVQFHNIQTSGVLSDGTDFRLLLDDASVDIHADTPDIHWALDARKVQLASPQLLSKAVRRRMLRHHAQKPRRHLGRGERSGCGGHCDGTERLGRCRRTLDRQNPHACRVHEATGEGGP